MYHRKHGFRDEGQSARVVHGDLPTTDRHVARQDDVAAKLLSPGRDHVGPATARGQEKPPKMPPKSEGESLPLEERIRRRAYELYVDRGAESGSEIDDWLRAEEEIQSALEQQQKARSA